MSLPAIPSYPLPGADELPGNRVGWRPEPHRAVLLIHDMQNYFLRAFDRSAAPIPQLLANIALLRTAAADAGIPVIYTAQPGAQTFDQRGLLQDFWGDGIGAGEHEQQVTAELAPGPGDVLLTKWRYSAFVRTDLRERLAELGRDQLLICGIYAHIGVLMTAADAFMHEIQPFLVADAVADFSAEDHRMALRYAAQRCAVTTTTDELAGALRATQPA